MHPLLFDPGFLKIGSYGFILLISIGITLYLLRFYAAKENQDYRALITFYFVIIIPALLGAKLLHLAISYREVFGNPRSALTILLSGGVYYGGYLIGICAIFLYSKYKGFPFLKMMDIFSILAVLALGISRIGCFLSGCCFGKPSNVPWAVTFTNPIGHRIHPDLPYVPVHPTQLYETLACLIIFIILNMMYLRKKFDGQIGISLFIFYGLARSYIEMYRGDFRGSVFGGLLSTSQFLGLLTALIASCFYIYLLRKNKTEKINQKESPPTK